VRFLILSLRGSKIRLAAIRDIDTTSQEIAFDALVPVYCNILVALSRCAA